MNMVEFAAQVCGMAVQGRDYQLMPTTARDVPLYVARKSVNKLAITAKDVKGLYQYDFVNNEGLELECWLEYEAAHDGGTGPNSEESWPESISLVYAIHLGEDISEVLSDDVCGLIEEKALHNMTMDKWNSEYDRAADRAEDRRAA